MLQLNMELDQFEQFVEEAVKSIPDEFRKHLDNVSLVIEEFPTYYQAHKMRLRHKWQLFGLYEGVPLNKRGHNYAGVLPDKITLFKRPIEHYSRDLAQLKRIIANVVWHEIGHYFGMNEEEVRTAEKKRGHVY